MKYRKEMVCLIFSSFVNLLAYVLKNSFLFSGSLRIFFQVLPFGTGIVGVTRVLLTSVLPRLIRVPLFRLWLPKPYGSQIQSTLSVVVDKNSQYDNVTFGILCRCRNTHSQEAIYQTRFCALVELSVL